MKKKFNLKDILIIALSIICLCLLIFIIYASRKSSEMVSEMLENDSELVASTVAETEKVFTDYIELSEASSEKYIELYNFGTDSIDLSGIKILLAGEEIGTIGDGTLIDKNQYIAIDLKKNPGDAKANIITLKDKDGNDIAGYLLPQITAGKSYGKRSADSKEMGFMSPTKGKANDPKEIEYVSFDGIKFSTPSGFYSGAFPLTLEAGPGEKIYYTTDGTMPTTKSDEYVEPIMLRKPSSSDAVYSKIAFDHYQTAKYTGGAIDRAMVVNAIRVDGSGKVTGQASQIYFIDMARDVSYRNIPIISVTMDPEDLIGYESGIYVSGKGYDDALIAGEAHPSNFANYLSKEKKDCQVTFFEASKGKSLESDGKIGIYYNSEVNSVQKAFKITMDGSIWKYVGSSLLDYIDGNYELIVQQNLDDEDIKLREYIANGLMEDTAVGTYEMTPVVLFLNGEYWGAYMLKAPYDTKYFAKEYGVSEDGLNIRKYYYGVYNQSFRTLTDYITTNDMSVPENYEHVKEIMDIDSYLTYVCGNIYLANSKLGTTRTSTWKTVDASGTGYSDGRWRWLMDFTGDTMNSTRKQNYKINTFMQPGVHGDRVFQSLLMNKEFCNRMVEVMEKLIAENFSKENYTEVIEYYSNLMKKPAMDSHSRFYSSYSETEFSMQVDNIYTFFENRADYIMQYTRELAQKGGDMAYVQQYEEQALEENPDEQTYEELNSTEDNGDETVVQENEDNTDG